MPEVTQKVNVIRTVILTFQREKQSLAYAVIKL